MEAKAPAVRELNKDEAMSALDRCAQLYLRLSAREFLEKWDAGAYKAEHEDPRVMRVAMLLPLVR